MKGILQLTGDEGAAAQSLEDTAARQSGALNEANTEARAQNFDEAANLAGRALSSGISTYKDYKDHAAKVDAYNNASTEDRAKMTDPGGFNIGKDFVANVTGVGRFPHLHRVLQAQDPADASNPAGSVPTPQLGAISALNQHNSPLYGSVIRALHGNEALDDAGDGLLQGAQ